MSRLHLPLALLLSVSMPAIGSAMEESEIAMHALEAKHVSADNDSFVNEVAAGHTDVVQLFLKIGAQIGTQNKDGTSALMATLQNTKPDTLNLLLTTLPNDASAGTVLNLKDTKGNTALLMAIEQGNEAFVDMLIAHGADITLATPSRVTPLMLAVQKKNEALVKKLLAADPNSVTVPLEDSKGNTALVYAIDEQEPGLVKLLIDAHANAVAPDTIGITPLMLAAERGDESIAQMLITAGAKISDANKSGNTPISIAISKGHSKLARMLIEKDAAGSATMNYVSTLNAELDADPIDPEFFAYLLDHTKKDEKLPPSMLFKALDRKSHDVAMLLIARNPDVKATNENSETLFYHAIDSGFEDVTLKLMEMGADTSQTGVSGISLIARAVRHNMAKVVTALIAKGAVVDQKTTEGYTLAEMCVYSGYPETLEVLLNNNVKLEKEFALLWSIRDGKGKAVPVLLNHGATSNIMNQDGIPAISLAAEAGEVEAIKAFIDHKATLDYPSKTQHSTALSAGAHAGHLEVVKMLVEAGAALESTDNFGMTPLAHAAVTSKADVVEYLLSKGANARALDNQKRSISDIAGQAPPSPERDKIIALLNQASVKPKQ